MKNTKKLVSGIIFRTLFPNLIFLLIINVILWSIEYYYFIFIEKICQKNEFVQKIMVDLISFKYGLGNNHPKFTQHVIFLKKGHLVELGVAFCDPKPMWKFYWWSLMAGFGRNLDSKLEFSII